MTITIEKKHVFAFLGIVAIILLSVLTIKSCDKADYETTAKDMKLNAMIATNIAGQILSDYQNNWNSAIKDNRAINSNGESEWCNEFNQAIAWRFMYYTKNGYLKVLDSIANVVKEDMKIMEDAPSKFVETQKSFLSLYNDMNTLISLVKEPKGSLISFGQRVNELLLDTERLYNETDLKITISDAEINDKTAAVQQVFNEIIANSPEMQAKKLADKENEERKARNKKFLEENAKKEGVISLPNGLQYKIIKEGKGAIPKGTSKVKVNYEGKDIDGNVFDSTYELGKPAEFRANQVIRGWTEILTMMPVGSVWEVYIPQELGYGEREAGTIKPYSTLIFKIELLKIINN